MAKDDVIYIEPGQSTQLRGRNGSKIVIRASAGPILGPPWQRPENGYFIGAEDAKFSLYYEPHCVYNRSSLEREHADIIITPVVKQLLPAFTLVSGQEDAVELARLLKARYIVPMNNGDLESTGILSRIIHAEGTVESFKNQLSSMNTQSVSEVVKASDFMAVTAGQIGREMNRGATTKVYEGKRRSTNHPEILAVVRVTFFAGELSNSKSKSK
eukprot:Gb_31537 [translate_table: standard]